MAHLIRSDNQGHRFCEHCGLEIFTNPCAFSSDSPEMVIAQAEMTKAEAEVTKAEAEVTKSKAEKAKVNVCKYCFSAFH